jgi:hypothetical protein
MTPGHLMLRMTNNLIAALLGLASAAAFAQQSIEGSADIPPRSTDHAGTIQLSPTTKIRIIRQVSGFWGAKKLELEHNGQVTWTSPWTNSGISPGCLEGECQFVKLDLDGNKRPDWLFLIFPRGLSGFVAASSYGDRKDYVREFSEEESAAALAKPWKTTLCGWLSGLVVLDDEKTAYVFTYSSAPDPFMHRNPFVQGKEHYKEVVSGQYKKDRLETSEPIPDKIWRSIQQLVEVRACNTERSFEPRKLPLDQRIQWHMKPEPYGLDWHPYFKDGLAMYGRAKQLYESSKVEIAPEDRGTKDVLGMFDLHAFFETFPFDEIDPDNKSPEYTAMLNDFAFYQMAPENADEAVGFENKRKPVEGGVLAMLAHVIRRDPKRAVAYLNLADALWRNKQDAQAAPYYREYIKLMKASQLKSTALKRASTRAAITSK